MKRILPRILRTRPIRAVQPPDPLDHPDLETLSPRELADLPRIALTCRAQ